MSNQRGYTPNQNSSRVSEPPPRSSRRLSVYAPNRVCDTVRVNKKQILKSLSNTYCRLAATKHGVGVVAIRTIPKGTDPFINCDPFGTVVRIPEAELNTSDAPEEAKQMVRDFCALQGGMYHVPSYGIDAIDKSFYLNHSTSPNMETLDQGETFVAARDIQKGEELTANYELYHEYVKIFTKKK